MFSLKRHFVTEHENVLSVRYVNPKDIKSSYFRKVTAVNWCNVLWLMVEDATTKSYFAWTERKDYQGIWRYGNDFNFRSAVFTFISWPKIVNREKNVQTGHFFHPLKNSQKLQLSATLGEIYKKKTNVFNYFSFLTLINSYKLQNFL